MDELIIKELASLNPLDYDRRRKIEAEILGVSVTALDGAIKLAKRESGTSDAKGRTIELYEPEPWPDSINGAQALTEALNHILRHMVIKEADAIACVLWAAHTYMFDGFGHSPRLLITAHTEESGKTLLMTHMVGNLANRPQAVELMKPAPFFRLAEEFKPTFLIDECDVFVRDDMDLLAALNNGWEPHGGVPRCVGDDNEVRVFSTFTPTAMAGIELHKKLPSTTLTRSIVIGLERATEDEIKDDNIFNIKLHQAVIRKTGRKIARFIQDHRQDIASLTPVLPNGVRNRMAQKWSPLFAIAQVAGGEWPELAKKALFGQVDLSEPCRALELLQDIKKVLPPTGHIHTQVLIDNLCTLEDSVWVEYNFKAWESEKKIISSRQLSNLLKKYGLNPKDVKVSGINRKGYRRDDLDNAFRRYIPRPPLPPELSATPLQRSTDGTSSDSESATAQILVADANPLDPAPHKESSGVADDLPLDPEKERVVL